MPAERLTVNVVADWVGLGGPVRMGWLHATPSKGKEIFSFEYDRAWLGSKIALVVDSGLRLEIPRPTGGVACSFSVGKRSARVPINDVSSPCLNRIISSASTTAIASASFASKHRAWSVATVQAAYGRCHQGCTPACPFRRSG